MKIQELVKKHTDSKVIFPKPLSDEEVTKKFLKGEVLRAHGDLLCNVCGLRYILRPEIKTEPTFQELCDGTIVKL
jgi:hypothetical protein